MWRMNEQVKSLLSHPGCWLNDTPRNGVGCPRVVKVEIDRGYWGHSTECKECPAYQAFYRVAHDYMKAPMVRRWSEAVWLAGYFYGLKKDYMCDGENEEWLKQYAPKRYKDNLARQAALMSGIEPPEPSAPMEEDGVHQMTIFDLIGV